MLWNNLKRCPKNMTDLKQFWQEEREDSFRTMCRSHPQLQYMERLIEVIAAKKGVNQFQKVCILFPLGRWAVDGCSQYFLMNDQNFYCVIILGTLFLSTLELNTDRITLHDKLIKKTMIFQTFHIHFLATEDSSGKTGKHWVRQEQFPMHGFY